jgi:hypothetical protein
MKQIKQWKVNQDNVKFYNSIVCENGRVLSLDYRPYVEFLTKFGILFTVSGMYE